MSGKRKYKTKNTSWLLIDTKTGRSKKVGSVNHKIKKRLVVIDTKTGKVSYRDVKTTTKKNK